MTEGIKESEELVNGIVAVARALKDAQQSNGFGFDDVGLLFKIMPELNAAIDGAYKIPGEAKDYDSAEIKKLATDALGAFSDGSDAKVYVEEAFNLVDYGVKAFQSVNRILSAVKT